jgi:hypothetical protein
VVGILDEILREMSERVRRARGLRRKRKDLLTEGKKMWGDPLMNLRKEIGESVVGVNEVEDMLMNLMLQETEDEWEIIIAEL